MVVIMWYKYQVENDLFHCIRVVLGDNLVFLLQIKLFYYSYKDVYVMKIS